MGYFVKLNEMGIVQEAVFTTESLEGFSQAVNKAASEGEIQTHHPLDAFHLANMMLENGVLVPRPVSPKPYSTDGIIIVPPCPDGTAIHVYDITGQEVLATIIAETDDFEETFEFVDSGTYRVEVEAPFPHLTTFCEVKIE